MLEVKDMTSGVILADGIVEKSCTALSHSPAFSQAAIPAEHHDLPQNVLALIAPQQNPLKLALDTRTAKLSMRTPTPNPQTI